MVLALGLAAATEVRYCTNLALLCKRIKWFSRHAEVIGCFTKVAEQCDRTSFCFLLCFETVVSW